MVVKVESEKRQPDRWSDCGQIFFTDGKAFAVTPNLRTICLGNRFEVQSFLDNGRLDENLTPIQKETLIGIRENNEGQNNNSKDEITQSHKKSGEKIKKTDAVSKAKTGTVPIKIIQVLTRKKPKAIRPAPGIRTAKSVRFSNLKKPAGMIKTSKKFKSQKVSRPSEKVSPHKKIRRLKRSAFLPRGSKLIRLTKATGHHKGAKTNYPARPSRMIKVLKIIKTRKAIIFKPVFKALKTSTQAKASKPSRLVKTTKVAKPLRVSNLPKVINSNKIKKSVLPKKVFSDKHPI